MHQIPSGLDPFVAVPRPTGPSDAGAAERRANTLAGQPAGGTFAESLSIAIRASDTPGAPRHADATRVPGPSAESPRSSGGHAAGRPRRLRSGDTGGAQVPVDGGTITAAPQTPPVQLTGADGSPSPTVVVDAAAATAAVGTVAPVSTASATPATPATPATTATPATPATPATAATPAMVPPPPLRQPPPLRPRPH